MFPTIDRLMQETGAELLWVTGPAQHNPQMVYFTGVCHMSMADLFYRPGQEPVVFCNAMEREEAAKAGYPIILTNKYDFRKLLDEAKGDRAVANARMYQQLFKDLGIERGKVLVYGVRELGPMLSLTQLLHEFNPDLTFDGDVNGTVLMQARALKTPAQLELIRQMGIRTTTVVGKVRDFLASHKVKDETLVKEDGSPLKLGEVKKNINLWLSEAGCDNPEGTIFALGRDAAFPHSIGNPDDNMVLGKTIVFDIFPCEAGGGYFYDFTRTWCLGYAPDEIQKAYDDVRKTYDTVVASMREGMNAAWLQETTCDSFEALGHETVRKNPRIESGYVHGLGHGVGLNVHEKPATTAYLMNDPKNILQRGSVITVEPGLYYPEKGFGIRLEDTWCLDHDGTFHKMVEFPMDLVIPMRG